jgi:hypothetical protein
VQVPCARPMQGCSCIDLAVQGLTCVLAQRHPQRMSRWLRSRSPPAAPPRHDPSTRHLHAWKIPEHSSRARPSTMPCQCALCRAPVPCMCLSWETHNVGRPNIVEITCPQGVQLMVLRIWKIAVQQAKHRHAPNVASQTRQQQSSNTAYPLPPTLAALTKHLWVACVVPTGAPRCRVWHLAAGRTGTCW